MTDWPAHLDGHLDRAWSRLTRAVADRRAASRTPVLSTVGADGAPEARTVVLRAADRASATLEIHSDARTGKTEALAADPRAALTAWEPGDRLQIRLAAEIALLTGEEAAGHWARLPEVTRGNYGVAPAPGTPIPRAEAYERTADPATFAVLRVRLTAIETLHLGDPHRRARFTASDDWRGTWLAP